MSRPKKHGFAALAPADVGDAKRGRPDFDLHGYAADRGLELLDPRRNGFLRDAGELDDLATAAATLGEAARTAA